MLRLQKKALMPKKWSLHSEIPFRLVNLLRPQFQIDLQGLQFFPFGAPDNPLFLDDNRDFIEAHDSFSFDEVVAGCDSDICGALGPVQIERGILPGLDDEFLGPDRAGIEKAAFQESIKPLLITGELIERIGVFELIDAHQEGMRFAVTEV